MMNHLKGTALAMAFTGLGLAGFAQTSAPNGWHLKDQKGSGLYGISLDKAYQFVKGKKGQTVIVAVIDSGIDTLHEDLKQVLWTNPKEVPGNGIDDDGNGYVDDVHGWNFLGGRDGRNVKEDSYEAARVYHAGKAKFENASEATLTGQELADYKEWKRARESVVSGVDENEMAMIRQIYPNLKKGDSIIAKDLGKEEYSGKELQAYDAKAKEASMAKSIILSICAANGNNFDITNKMLLDDIEGQLRKADAANTPPPNYRGDIVQDNENDINDRFYGNNDIMASTPFHGTHVSGIIAAVRGNGKGIDGIADNVRIMTLRAVPDGDEHDKDIALAIRYAVDNGAKVINMSFGKSFSPQKKWVDEAVAYAESKNVLLVHAAGNDAKNLDQDYNFPTPVFQGSSRRATNWLTIGASGDPKNGGLAASFSNFGKKEVDVFAPGVNIYSTVPGGTTYGNASGTSMASPVTAGVAAFLLSYYPNLSAKDVKSILEKSATKPTIKADKPGTEDKVAFSELSRTGGLVNAFEAAKMAAQMSAKKPAAKNTMKVKQPVKN